MIDLLIIPVMGGLNRWRGHASDYKKYFPRPWSQLCLALPFGYIAYKYSAIPEIIPYQEYFTGAAVTLLTLGAWLTGWGNIYDLANSPRGEKLEKIEYLIYWLYGRIPEYWYDFIGMALRGMLITIPAGVAVLDPLFALSGASMAIAYAIGWKMYPEGSGKGIPHLNEATAVGEFLAGCFAGLCIYLFMVIFN